MNSRLCVSDKPLSIRTYNKKHLCMLYISSCTTAQYFVALIQWTNTVPARNGRGKFLLKCTLHWSALQIFIKTCVCVHACASPPFPYIEANKHTNACTDRVYMLACVCALNYMQRYWHFTRASPTPPPSPPPQKKNPAKTKQSSCLARQVFTMSQKEQRMRSLYAMP